MVLVAGGYSNGVVLAATELYDPASGDWTFTGSLNTPRDGHTATLLLNGMVLVAGGITNGDPTTAELYDPASGDWTFTGSLSIGHSDYTATLLLDGSVLVAGGPLDNDLQYPISEVYDSSSGTWTRTGFLTTQREGPTATLLSNGKVLIAGGSVPDPDCTAYDPDSSAELYISTSPIITSPLVATGTTGLPFSYHFETPMRPHWMLTVWLSLQA